MLAYHEKSRHVIIIIEVRWDFWGFNFDDNADVMLFSNNSQLKGLELHAEQTSRTKLSKNNWNPEDVLKSG